MLVGQNEIWSRELGFWRFAFHQIQTNSVSSKEFQAKLSFYMVGPLSSIFAPRIRVMQGQIGVKIYLEIISIILPTLWMVLTYNLLQDGCIDDGWSSKATCLFHLWSALLNTTTKNIVVKFAMDFHRLFPVKDFLDVLNVRTETSYWRTNHELCERC